MPRLAVARRGAAALAATRGSGRRACRRCQVCQCLLPIAPFAHSARYGGSATAHSGPGRRTPAGREGQAAGRLHCLLSCNSSHHLPASRHAEAWSRCQHSTACRCAQHAAPAAAPHQAECAGVVVSQLLAIRRNAAACTHGSQGRGHRRALTRGQGRGELAALAHQLQPDGTPGSRPSTAPRLPWRHKTARPPAQGAPPHPACRRGRRRGRGPARPPAPLHTGPGPASQQGTPRGLRAMKRWGN